MAEDVIFHRSEIFDATVLSKQFLPGMTCDRYIISIHLKEDDPKLQLEADVEISEGDYRSLALGDRVNIRLYEYPDGKWREAPPPLKHDPNRGISIIGDGD